MCRGEDCCPTCGKVKSAIKYKYVYGNPTGSCFQESVQFGAQNYDNNFRPVFDKVREVLEALPLAHKEVDEVVIPGWECGDVEVCTSLKGEISEKKDCPHRMLAYGREYLEKWQTYLKIYTDGSKCEKRAACAFYVLKFKVHSQFRLS